MRILVDEEELAWDSAWTIVTNTFFFTNHTVLPVRLHPHQPSRLKPIASSVIRKLLRSGQYRSWNTFFQGTCKSSLTL